MRIGGFQKFTLIDYPGKIAATVFTQGCNFRCGYCHNSQLACPSQFQDPIEEWSVLEFLLSRQGKLQGVVVTGGEPTIQKGLLEFLAKLRSMNFKIKLDTNGSHPDILATIIDGGLVDFIAMDIKTSLSRYEEVIGVKVDTQHIKKSIDLIIQSNLSHQFRTTLVKKYCSENDLKDIQILLGTPRSYVLQSFVDAPTIMDKEILKEAQYTSEDIQDFRLKFQREF
ncbi:MAG: anaerobic ribonucleoside-triphosphate reductase activating protein [Candidatus Omnitrophica bacterium]|nr:anaerobic ribonucleoside-triphosphate reductase activating protein [Candidatus Omnitrophota bacterium]